MEKINNSNRSHRHTSGVSIRRLLMIWVSAALTVWPMASALADAPAKSFEGVWRSTRHIVSIRHSDRGYIAKSITFGGRPALGQKNPESKWVSWGTSSVVNNTLTYKFSATLPGAAGGANIKTSKFTLSADGQGLVEVSTDQLIVAGQIKSSVAHPAVQYIRVHVKPAAAGK